MNEEVASALLRSYESLAKDLGILTEKMAHMESSLSDIKKLGGEYEKRIHSIENCLRSKAERAQGAAEERVRLTRYAKWAWGIVAPRIGTWVTVGVTATGIWLLNN